MPDPAGSAAFLHIIFAVQLGLGLVFLLSALPKLARPAVFIRAVVAYDLLPSRVARGVAVLLIVLEACLAASFLSGWGGDIALPLAMLLLLAFLGAVGINLRRGRRVPCSCFGSAREHISARTLARLLLLVAAVAALAAVRVTAGEPVSGLLAGATRSLSPADFVAEVTLAISFLVLAGWALALPQLARLVRTVRWKRATPDSATMEGA